MGRAVLKGKERGEGVVWGGSENGEPPPCGTNKHRPDCGGEKSFKKKSPPLTPFLGLAVGQKFSLVPLSRGHNSGSGWVQKGKGRGGGDVGVQGYGWTPPPPLGKLGSAWHMLLCSGDALPTTGMRKISSAGYFAHEHYI